MTEKRIASTTPADQYSHRATYSPAVNDVDYASTFSPTGEEDPGAALGDPQMRDALYGEARGVQGRGQISVAEAAQVLIAALGIGVIFWLVRQARRPRMRLVPISPRRGRLR